jgi:putative transposase
VETWLRGQGVQPISSTPGHPQTQGKSERHHQTSQRWLAARPAAPTLADLQGLLDQLEDAYNNRPHQSLGMLTPLQAWAATPVTPSPAPTPIPEHCGDGPDRDAIDRRTVHANGVVHVRDIRIQLGIEHAGSTVLTTYANDDIHVWDRDGLHLRTITVIHDRNYYGNGRRRGRPRPTELSGK